MRSPNYGDTIAELEAALTDPESPLHRPLAWHEKGINAHPVAVMASVCGVTPRAYRLHLHGIRLRAVGSGPGSRSPRRPVSEPAPAAPPKRTPGPRARVSEEAVRAALTASTSYREAAKRLGVTPVYLTNRVAVLRRAGADLPRYTRARE